MKDKPSLRSQLNQIRMWVRQGRTDAWIAHTLDISIDQLAQFKRDHDLSGESASPPRAADPLSVPPPEAPAAGSDREPEQEVELEPAEVGARAHESLGDEEQGPSRVEARATGDGAEAEDRSSRQDGARPERKRRGRRGGRRRSKAPRYEATFDHGEEGYGLWLDPAVSDDPLYAEHWAGHRAVTVTIGAESITIRRLDTVSPRKDDRG